MLRILEQQHKYNKHRNVLSKRLCAERKISVSSQNFIMVLDVLQSNGYKWNGNISRLETSIFENKDIVIIIGENKKLAWCNMPSCCTVCPGTGMCKSYPYIMY